MLRGMRVRPLRFVAAGMAAFSLGCGDGVDLPEPSVIVKLSETDGQEAPAGARLPLPLRVVVRASDGAVVPRAGVRWRVVQGSGASLSDSVTISDGTGVAEAVLTLGSETGEYLVRAELVVDDRRGTSFTAVASLPPELTTVEPDAFGGGDEITIRGARLRGVEIDIGGATATVLSVSVTGLGLTARVPPCLAPGTVKIVARIRGARSNAIEGTFVSQSQPVRLEVGEYASIDPAALAGCAVFPALSGDSSAEYLFVPQAATGEPGVAALYRFKGDAAAAAIARAARLPDELPFAVRFHDFLRAHEAATARRPRPAPGAARGVLLAQLPAVGDSRDFHVCSDVKCSEFKLVSAEARYVGDRAAIYVDRDAPAGLTQDVLNELGRMFDEDLYEVATRAFGAESDVDQNGLVLILMTPVVNGLTPKERCETSVVTGFFFNFDVDPIFSGDERSNQAEVFYSITPDPSGSVTCEHSAGRVKRLVPVTFIHELQHMISYNQHVLVRGGNTEHLWLNEAMSHLAEELGGWHFLGLGDSVLFSQFAIGNLFNAYQYLSDPGQQFVLFKDGTGSLAERGAAWLFVRWLVDHYGDDIPRRMSETVLRGSANVAAAAGESFSRLISDWILSNYVSDLPDASRPPRLTYTTWDFRKVYGSLHEQVPERFDRPFPLVPQSFAGGVFDVSGSLRSGSGDYFTVVQAPTDSGFTVQFTSPTGGPVDARAVPRLNVIRIR